jgi:glycosyltransferase involved in cell wall biosynthesis
MSLKILYIIPSYAVNRGGPTSLVKELSQALVRGGIQVDILTTSKAGEELCAVPDGARLIQVPRSGLAKLWTGFSWGVIKFLKNNLGHYDLIHIHELWHFPHLMAYLLHRNVPYVVTIHGGLDDWCLSHKNWKKKIYSYLIQKKIISRADMIHVLSQTEKGAVIKYLGYLAENIKIIPNGIDVTAFENLLEEGSEPKRQSQFSNKKYIIFLGRIHQVKGLDLLVRVFQRLSPEYPDLFLVIAGSDNDGYGGIIKKIIENYHLENKIIFSGILTGEEKVSALSDAQAFVLPSYSECFPMAMVEAMACRTPVIISNQVGIYKDVAAHQAGIVVETNPESLYQGLKKVLDNENLRQSLTDNATKMVQEHFNIKEVAQLMIRAYQEITNKNI